MDILEKASGSLEKLRELEILGKDPENITWIGLYIPFGVDSKLKVIYNLRKGKIVSYALSSELGVERGEGIDIPDSISKICKTISLIKSKVLDRDYEMEIIFYMRLSIASELPECPEKYISEKFYTLYMVSYWEGDDAKYLPIKQWADVRVMSQNLKVYNSLDFAKQPMQILDTFPDLFKTYCSSNPFARMLSGPVRTLLRGEEALGGNRYLFIPTKSFLRQRVQTWYISDEKEVL